MKFNFFVLIACLLIHFIAQAGSEKKSVKPLVKPAAKIERQVAADKSCDCAP